MDSLLELLGWLRPDGQVDGVTEETRLQEDLQLTSCEMLGLVAMVESFTGRMLRWEAKLLTVGDLLDYLALQGIAIEEVLE